MTGAGLADPYRVRLGDQTTQVIRGAQATGGRIFYRDGVTSQITPVGRTLTGPGIWLQAGMATQAERDGRLPGVVLDLRRGPGRRLPGGRDLPQPGPGTGPTVLVLVHQPVPEPELRQRLGAAAAGDRQ